MTGYLHNNPVTGRIAELAAVGIRIDRAFPTDYNGVNCMFRLYHDGVLVEKLKVNCTPAEMVELYQRVSKDLADSKIGTPAAA